MPKRSRRDSSTLANCDRPPEGRFGNSRANRSYGRTPSSACAHKHACPRTRFRQRQHGNENQTRPNHDFRFHGIAIINTFMLMTSRHATLIVAGFAGILAMLSGCATVKSTAAYYTSYLKPSLSGEACRRLRSRSLPGFPAVPARPIRKTRVRERSRLAFLAQEHGLQRPGSWRGCGRAQECHHATRDFS